MNDLSKNSTRFTSLAVVVELGMGVIAIGAGAWLGWQPLACFSRDPQIMLRSLLLGLLATLPMLVMLILLDRFPRGPFRELRTHVMDKVVVLFRDLSVVQMAFVALAAGIGEELLFRGLLQKGLDATTSGQQFPLLGLAVASLVFGICHWITPLYALLATLVGFYLGALLIVADDLSSPIITHAAYDFAALCYLTRAAGNSSESQESP